MNVIHKELATALTEMLRDAEEVWIAVALISDQGFSQLQDLISETCIQHYLVGIDLPTRPTVLKTLKQHIVPNKFEAKIYKSSNTFHPKIYITKFNNGYKAIVGSANLTDGGLRNNIEMSVLIDGAECTKLMEWFVQLYGAAYPLTDENIHRYEQSIDGTEEYEKEIKKKRDALVLTTQSSNNLTLEEYLDSIDFSNHFFKKHNHLAFLPIKWESDDPEVNGERNEVVKQLIRLHGIIYPQFHDYGLGDLHSHFNQKYLTSLHYHIPGFTQDALRSIWLHYSKSEPEIRYYEKNFKHNLGQYNKAFDRERNITGFANQIRLQVIVHNKNVGIWLYIGKKNDGSPFDRENIKKVLRAATLSTQFFEYVRTLPKEYYMEVGEQRYSCDHFNNIDDFLRFWKGDNPKVTSYIGKDYPLEAVELLENNFPTVVLTNFSILYPIYDLLRDKPSIR